MRAEVTRVVVTDTPERLEALARVAADVRGAGSIAALDTDTGDAVRGRGRAPRRTCCVTA